MVIAVDEAFAEIDTNQNGTIGYTELLQHLLGKGQEPETISELFASLDTNKDGQITREAFAAGFEKYKTSGPPMCSPAVKMCLRLGRSARAMKGVSLRCTLTGHSNSVLGLAFDPAGTLASCSSDHSIIVWDIDTGLAKFTLTGHSGSVSCLAICEDVLVSGSWEKNHPTLESQDGRANRIPSEGS